MGNPRKIFAIVTGLCLSGLLLFVVFGLLQGRFTRASDETPQNVQVQQITGTTATISWTTGVATEGGVIQYGISPAALNSYAPVESEKSMQHSVNLSLLTPATTYYFEIVYGQDKIYDNGGAPWTFVTKGDEDIDDITSGFDLDAAQRSPTPAPTVPTTPTPVALPTTAACNFSDCEMIRSYLGRGCSTQEYMKCLRK